MPIRAFLAGPFDESTVWSTMMVPADERRVAARLEVLVEEVHRVAAAEPEVDRIDVLGERRDDRGEVLGAERDPETLGHFAAEGAELEHQPEYLGVDERVVFPDGGDGAIALLVVDVLGESGRPLRARPC